jgi:hypothetical protein
MSESHYQPGRCNIGPREVAVRKKIFVLFLALTIVVSFLHLCTIHTTLCFGVLVLLSFAAIVIYFEVKYSFCILFGFFNLYNFHHLGNLNDVNDKADGKKDRKRVKQILAESLVLAIVYSTLLHLAANYFFV